MRTPNLPVRWEIERVSNGAVPNILESICCTVASEGGQQILGKTGSVDRAVAPINITLVGGLKPVIAIRLKAAQIRRTIKLSHFDVYSATAGNSLWRLLLNPTRGIGTAPTWTGVTNYAVEYDVASTQVLTGGVQLDAGYLRGQTTGTFLSLPNEIPIAAQDVAGLIPDELVIAALPTTGNDDFLAALQWIEL